MTCKILFAFICSCLFSLPFAKAHLVDQTGILQEKTKQKIEGYIQFVRKQYQIDYWIVIMNIDEREELSVWANKLYDQNAVGRETQGKGLLLLLDIAHHRSRVEVGYSLEPYITDIQATELIRNFLLPHYKAANLRAAVEATIEFLVDEVKKHLPAMAQDPTYMGSGGGGKEVHFLDELPSGALSEEWKGKLRRILVPQSMPEASYKLEIAMMKKGHYFTEVPLFDLAWQKRSGPEFPAVRNKDIARMMEQPYKVISEGHSAVLYYTGSQVMGPVFFTQGDSGWVIDRSSVMKIIVYDYSNEGWYALDRVSPHLELLKKVFPLKRVTLSGGRAAWMLPSEKKGRN